MGFWDGWLSTVRGWRYRAKLSGEPGSDGPTGTDSHAGERVTPQAAMQLSAFWACVRLISQTIATLPVGIYQKDAKGERVSLSDHPLYRLLHDSPNADQTAVEFWEGRLLGLCTAGNGYAEKIMEGSRLVSLNPMPADTWCTRDRDGALLYRYFDRGKQVELPESQVFHIRGFGDGDAGLSPVTFARHTLGLAVATERAAGQVFGRGMRAKGFFTTDKTLDAEQRKQAREALIEPFSGPDGKQWGILEAGFDFKTVSLSAKDSEMILSRKFNVEDICRWLGVPPVLIGHAAEGQTMWGSGIEQIMLGWLTLGLRPYLTRIEQAAKKRLLTSAERAQGIYIEFNVEGLLRADSAGRAALFSVYSQNGLRTRNELRRLDNQPPLPGGDMLTVQSALTPLATLGQQTTPPPPSDDPTKTLLPPITVPVTVHTPEPAKQRAERTVITRHDEKGRIAEFVRYPVED